MVLDRNIDYVDYYDFLEEFYKSHPIYQNQICDFFLHGFLMGHYYQSFLNMYVGDVQVRAFVSLLHNQVDWENQFDQYREA